MSTELGYAKYLSLTTFRRNGEPVTTPVWTVPIGDKVFVSTGERTGKAKRLRNNDHVQVALCDARGHNRGPAHEATARLVPVSEHPEMRSMMLEKYGILQRMTEAMEKVRSHTKKSTGDRVLIELTIDD